MVEMIWSKIFGNLEGWQVSIMAAVVAHIIEKVKDYRMKERGEVKSIADWCIEDAIIGVAKDNGTKLDVENDIPKPKGEQLLEEAAKRAEQLGQVRKIDIVEALGGKEGVKSAAQTAFTKIKASIRRD